MSPEEKIDVEDERVPGMCGRVLLAVKGAHERHEALTTEQTAAQIDTVMTHALHGPPFVRALFDAAVRRLVSEHLLVQLGAGVDERLVPGAQGER
jgi:hypothetical protein